MCAQFEHEIDNQICLKPIRNYVNTNEDRNGPGQVEIFQPLDCLHGGYEKTGFQPGTRTMTNGSIIRLLTTINSTNGTVLEIRIRKSTVDSARAMRASNSHRSMLMSSAGNTLRSRPANLISKPVKLHPTANEKVNNPFIRRTQKVGRDHLQFVMVFQFVTHFPQAETFDPNSGPKSGRRFRCD